MRGDCDRFTACRQSSGLSASGPLIKRRFSANLSLNLAPVGKSFPLVEKRWPGSSGRFAPAQSEAVRMPTTPSASAEPDPIAVRIMVLRGQRVLLDADLARIYGVTTKRLNEQVKRNLRRFPEEFVFQLTTEEVQELARSRSQIATLKRGLNIKHAPYAFTEHGAIQAANVLKSEAAVEMGVHVVRAFLSLRRWLGSQKALAAKLAEIEARVGTHDEQLLAVIEALRHLTASPEPTHRRRIGFHRC